MDTKPLVQRKAPEPTAHQPGSALAAMSLGPRHNTEFGLLAPSNPGLPVSAYMSGGGVEKDTRQAAGTYRQR